MCIRDSLLSSLGVQLAGLFIAGRSLGCVEQLVELGAVVTGMVGAAADFVVAEQEQDVGGVVVVGAPAAQDGVCLLYTSRCV